LSRIRGRCFIPTNNLNHALDKDIVKVYTTVEKERPEGEVIEVIERNKTDFVVIDIQKNFSFVSTANQRCIPIFLFQR
jgi:ribonuclease R